MVSLFHACMHAYVTIIIIVYIQLNMQYQSVDLAARDIQVLLESFLNLKVEDKKPHGNIIFYMFYCIVILLYACFTILCACARAIS